MPSSFHLNFHKSSSTQVHRLTLYMFKLNFIAPPTDLDLVERSMFPQVLRESAIIAIIEFITATSCIEFLSNVAHQVTKLIMAHNIRLHY